ncbi:MAG: hypothetical protein JHC98_01240 [Thermoleophilaceae bacterium]|nr:hypothetical protein [Thermoleophilaceae bacterium]
MQAVRAKPAFKAVAILAPLLAVAPIVLGLSGGWIALHLLGGATALVILIYSAYSLPAPWRWYAAVGVIISIVTIAVVTDGGSIGPLVQVGMLVLLGSIYISSVFWPHEAE